MMVPADLRDAVRSHRSAEAGGASASSCPAKTEAVVGGLQEENESNDTTLIAAAEDRRKRSVSRSQPTTASLRELEGWLTKQGAHG